MPVAVLAEAVIWPSITPMNVPTPAAIDSVPMSVNVPEAPTKRPVPPVMTKFSVTAKLPGIAVASARPLNVPVIVSPARKPIVTSPSRMSVGGSEVTQCVAVTVIGPSVVEPSERMSPGPKLTVLAKGGTQRPPGGVS